MWIAEVFESIQGEGLHAGTPSAFIRTSGCNLRCTWCDTPETSWRPRGEHREWREVLAEAAGMGCPHVVVTGGEPLLQPDVVPLTRALAEAGLVVTIETAGTVFREVHADLLSLSPKLSNSTPTDDAWGTRHEQSRDVPEVVARFVEGYDYQLKFVVELPGDLAEVEAYLERFPQVAPERVWLMPQAVTTERITELGEWIEPAAARRGWRVSPRLHIELFGNRPGT